METLNYEPIIPPNVRMVEEDDIAEFEAPPPEEETVEVTIPTESELKGMTKSKIEQEALIWFRQVSQLKILRQND